MKDAYCQWNYTAYHGFVGYQTPQGGFPKLVKEVKESRTSRPKAQEGHRYPRPAEWLVYGTLWGKQGFGPKGGRSPVERRGNLYVCTSIRPSVRQGFGGPQARGGDAKTNRQTDGRMFRFPLWSTGLCPPLGPKPKKERIIMIIAFLLFALYTSYVGIFWRQHNDFALSLKWRKVKKILHHADFSLCPGARDPRNEI